MIDTSSADPTSVSPVIIQIGTSNHLQKSNHSPSPPPRPPLHPHSHPAAHAPVRDSPKVMACMARAIKVANAAKQQAAAARPPGQVARCNTPINPTSSASPVDSSSAPLPAPSPASRSPHIALYIEILNQYLYYYDKGAAAFTTSAVQVSLHCFWLISPATPRSRCLHIWSV